MGWLYKIHEALGRAYAFLTATRARCLALSLGLSVVLFFAGTFAFIQSDVNDDFAISTALSGRLSDPQGLCLFINALLSQAIFWLNTHVTGLNWFIVALSLSAFLGFLTSVYYALSHMKMEIGCAYVALLTILSLPGLTMIDNFTYVAFIDACAGCTTLLVSLSEERHKLHRVLWAFLLLALCALWRFFMLLACIPVFGLAALYIALSPESRERGIAKALMRLWPFLASLLMVFCLVQYDQAVWSQSPWSDWKEFNDLRSLMSDYPHKPYAEVADDLAEIGVSENDYKMLYSWITEDTDFFTIEKLRQITDIATVDPLADKTPVEVLTGYFKHLASSSRLLVLLALFVVVVLVSTRGRSRWMALLLLAITLVIAICLYALGRLPARVHNPVWLYAAASTGCLAAVPIGQRSLLGRNGLHARRPNWVQSLAAIGSAAMPVAAIAIALVLFIPHFTAERITAVFAPVDYDAKTDLDAYLKSHPDTFYVMDLKSNRELRYDYYMRILFSEHLLYQRIPLGGWDARAPYMLARNAEAGMSNPITGLVENADVRYISGTDKPPDTLTTYLREHYYPNLAYDLVDTIDVENTGGKLYVFALHAG